MKVWKFAAMAVLMIVLVRLEHTGVRMDQLEPVETLRIRWNGETVLIETDTGAKGYGSDFEQAVKNLHSSSDSTVFLDTAQFVLLDRNTEALIGLLDQFVRPNTLLCIIKGECELKEVTAYLKIHKPKTRLLDWKAGEYQLETLYYKEGRGQLAG